VKIAQVCRSLLRNAGTERFILETTREMSRRGIETRIYTADVSNEMYANVSPFVKIEKTALIAMPRVLLGRHHNFASWNWSGRGCLPKV
jgi:hypothetical protein